MKAGSTIKKILFITLWVCIGAGMFTLLLAAINKKNKGECKNYIITIQGGEKNMFIDRNDIEGLLKKETKSNITGMPVSSFNLQRLEQVIQNDPWVSKAELYFDNQDVLHITITEEEPVARVFTTGTMTFYIDSAGRRMPLSDKLSARVPVFTGFPGKEKLTKGDSALLKDVKITANYIMSDPFWRAQTAQVDITEEKTFELIPVIGNHIVRLGNSDDIAKKFHRLKVFYEQVLGKTGFDRYRIIDVQYEGQVVASRSGAAKADTVQLRKNVEKLLKQAKETQNDTTRSAPAVSGRYHIEVDSVTMPAIEMPDDAPDNKKPVKEDPKTGEKRIPKAVMPKRQPVEDY